MLCKNNLTDQQLKKKITKIVVFQYSSLQNYKTFFVSFKFQTMFALI